MAKHVRVLVVDDSAFYRKRIRDCLEVSPVIRVIGEAADGEEAVRLSHELHPDLITMDVAMPVMDGIAAVRRIMRERPTPIVMFSAFTREGAQATLDALDAGAVDFLPKLDSANDAARTGELLRARVLELACDGEDGTPPRRETPPTPASHKGSQPSLLVIGASTGGPVAVQQVIAALPGDFPLPVLVGIHMPGTFTPAYAERLDALAALHAREAADGMPLRPGQVLVAPGGLQTRVSADGGLHVRVEASDDALYRPSVDLLLSSAAEAVGPRAFGIVLTGMGTDGAEGARRIHEAGGRVWAQDQASSVVYGMPAAVVRVGAAERVLALEEIADALREVC
ncbi:protein-glutamate methylesterase/protein-glutamine glutaminase [endosymbiont of unidentified scaly snail isolate Monju]|uniref:protein-glutamate methylesterase/protein-glutamine glutaminase n=1 Tax=endosymbiont of unidentified scaly snail isolate Monju TaxID=1248727 RepID=UPI0003891EB1|nr:chemotaxis response regulator protein-glutamate methylesterase [endosymbiont of unidentified scaly snail isolate Monju]BAN69596.1 two-component system, chemotaxis family, response regulator CheB [endosymbiont of unidentified scaly snail isolate Monju]